MRMEAVKHTRLASCKKMSSLLCSDMAAMPVWLLAALGAEQMVPQTQPGITRDLAKQGKGWSSQKRWQSGSWEGQGTSRMSSMVRAEKSSMRPERSSDSRACRLMA